MVNLLTINVITIEKAIHITPSNGEQVIPFLIAKPNEQLKSAFPYPNKTIRTQVNTKDEIIDHQQAVLVTFLEIKPTTNGPVKHPESVPQLSPIKYAIAVNLNFIFKNASSKEIAINTTQRTLKSTFIYATLINIDSHNACAR